MMEPSGDVVLDSSFVLNALVEVINKTGYFFYQEIRIYRMISAWNWFHFHNINY